MQNSIDNITKLLTRMPAGNRCLAKVAVRCSAESFVVTASSVLRMNICAEESAHRKSANRYGQG